MKATGIVRRIDELGRVVIPKEIRRTLHIREGDPLEIYTDREGQIILKKYSPIGEMGDMARQFAEALNRVTGHLAVIADRDAVLGASGPHAKDYAEKPLHVQLEQLMSERRSLRGGSPVALVMGDAGDYTAQMVVPILAEGEVIGTVSLCSRDSGAHLGDGEYKAMMTAAGFLGRHMES